MAAVESLRTHLVEELMDLLDAEQQLTKALPKLAAAATSRELRTALQKHLRETRGHVTRLNRALGALGESPQAKTCEAMQGLLEEGDTMVSNSPKGALRDAVIITGAQKVEHYEMASYGTARTYAAVLGAGDVAQLLARTLEEEKAADASLTRVAEGGVNEQAAAAVSSVPESEDKAEGTLTRAAQWMGTAAGTASRQLAKGMRTAASTVGLANERSEPRKPEATSSRPTSQRTRGRSPSRAATASTARRKTTKPRAGAQKRRSGPQKRGGGAQKRRAGARKR